MDEDLVTDSNKEMDELLLASGKIKLRDRILLSPFTKLLLPSLIIALVLPTTVYALMISALITDSTYSATTCNLRAEYRVECLPGVENVTETECEDVLCCWNETLSLCYHTVPSRHGYTPDEGVYYEGAVLTPREANSPLGSTNAAEVYLDITAVDVNHVEILISTSSQASGTRKRRGLRVEDPGEEDEITKKLLYFLPRDRNRRTVEIELDNSTNLNAYVHYPEFSVTVARDDFTLDETSSIFSTARGPFIMTETYWEWTMYLTNGSLFGLNDMEVNGTTNWIYNNENGTIVPAFLAIGRTGQSAAYYVDYKGPLEVQVLNASNLVILRGLALPESFSVHVFAGPTPVQAIQQLTAALASANPSGMPPLHNYGLHVCPKGNFYSVDQSVAELNETAEFLAAISAPWDSHCLHERLAPVLNHGLDADEVEALSGAKDALESDGRSFSPHLSPMIFADDGALQVELENSSLLLTNGSYPYLGEYQDSGVFYPDWTADAVRTVSLSYLENYLNDTSPATLWLRDAWPKDETNSSLKPGVDFSIFDYIPEELEFAMDTMTLPFDLETASGESHHKTHNLYSRGFRTLIRSSIPTIEFLGPPGEAGNTSWSGLRRSVRSAVGAGIVGKLPPPTNICGTTDFDTDVHDELCIRWYQAAVPWPYVTVTPDRLPGGSDLSSTASLTVARALRLRASLATYQHTVVARYFKNGSPVLAPTSVHYPEDSGFSFTWDQFMWGEAVLVGLVTLPGVSQVAMRLPGDVSWRHLMGGSEATPVTNGTTPVTATLGELVTLVRPGYIVPIHTDVETTTLGTMSSNVTLAVNMNCEYDSDCSAHGEIYYGLETGEFLNIVVNSTHLVLGNVTGVQSYACDNSTGSSQATVIQAVEILGNATYQVNTELCDLGEDTVAVGLA